jgi:glycosyltransferase involved in cell wall biosynthesis
MDESRPKMAVAVSVYNDAQVVGRAIESVLNQTLLPHELLIVDDGSEDQLESVVRAFGHPLIRYIRKEHGGLARARNHAVWNAEGDYIAFLDADDAYLPTYIEEVTGVLERSNADMVYTGYRLYNRDGSVRRESTLGMDGGAALYERLLCFGNFIAISTVTARVKLLQESGGFIQGLRVNCGCEDWDMWIRMSKNGRTVFIPKILVEKIFNPRGPYKRNGKLYRLDQREVVERGLQLDPYRALSYRRKALANLHYIWARVESEDRHFLRAAYFLFLGAIRYPAFPFRLLIRLIRLRAVRRGAVVFEKM